MTARRIFLVLICTLVLFVFIMPDVLGQPGDPDPPDNPIPITGIEYLLGGGIIYGIRSLLKARRK